MRIDPYRMLPWILMLLALPMAAQKKGYQQGYIITLEGDTLKGEVKDRSPEPFVELYGRIRFRPEGTRKMHKYGPQQIRGYAAGGRVYESLPLREETAFFRFRYYVDPKASHTFLRVMRREGPLTWYEQEFIYDDNHYLDSYPLFQREGNPEMVRVTQGIFGLKRQRLAEYFNDCPQLVLALLEDSISGVEEVFRYYLDSCASTDTGIRSKGINKISETDSGKLNTSLRFPVVERMEELRIPGVSVAVIEDYEVREILFFGQTGKNAAVNRHSLFQAASVSKLVTALLVHYYAAQGILDLDTDVNKYLSSWKIPGNPYTGEQAVTLRLLMSHRSGLPSTNFDYMPGQVIPTLNQILDGKPPALNKPAIPEEVPGRGWAYSNIGYALIQKILEDRLGKPLQEIAKEALFQPVGMDLSTFDYPLPGALAGNEAMPHGKDGKLLPPELSSPAKAQGGLLTTPEELARLLVELLKASKWESEVFPKPVADGLLHPAIALPFKMYGQDTRMGLGALLLGEGKQLAFMHNGYNSPGSVCVAIGFPYLGKGAVVMANSANGETLYLEILAALAETYGWPLGKFFNP